MKRIAILGSTGSIGTQTLQVIEKHPELLQVTALAAHSNHEKVAEQVRKFHPKYLAMFERSAADSLAKETNRKVASGMGGLIEIATGDKVDIVVVAVSGMIGLEPTIAAIRAKKAIALASKEVLVAGGAIVVPLAREHNVPILPVDSEHSAILQCLVGALGVPFPASGDTSFHKRLKKHLSQIEKIILTASGGPFRGYTLKQLENVTVEQALAHPTWRMGGKITIDSATLMNKGLEIIEACWLYDCTPEQIEIVIHPQSVIHAIVKFLDGSALAQMGHPDMKVPIQFALLGPERLPSPAKNWNPLDTPELTFEEFDSKVFICPNLAREAFRRGGVVPTVLNAVNEEAANAFLRGEISFLDIQRFDECSLSIAPNTSATLETILTADKEARVWYHSQART